MAQRNLRARQRQRQRIMLLVLLLILGVGGFFLFGQKPEPKKRVARPEPAGMVRLPTLNRDIGPGTRISKAMIRNSYRIPREVPTDALLSMDQFIGRYTTGPILTGQYITENDVSAEGAVGRYSAMAKPGMRLVVLSAKSFPGSLHTLKIGDRIDLLAFESTVTTNASPKKKYNSGAIDGNQPGTAGGGPKRKKSNPNASSVLKDTGMMSATLVAENAEVMSVPRLRNGRNISGHNVIVLQMLPQDAHITSLMAASGKQMRAVFRPYGDNTRLTQPQPLQVTTRLPKPMADPDVVNVIINGQTFKKKPNSTLFRAENETQQTHGQPNIIYGRDRSSQQQEGSEPLTNAIQISEFDGGS